MNPYVNEEVMWQRLKDIQREAENARLYGPHRQLSLAQVVGLLGRRVWLLAGLAMRRPPRPRPVVDLEDDRVTSDAA